MVEQRIKATAEAEMARRNIKPDKQLKEILPKAGLVYSEKATLSEVLCKPKLLPLKSATLLKLEEMENNLAQAQIAGQGVSTAAGSA